MTALSADTVALGADVATKLDAIRRAAELLVAAGVIDPAYGDSMLARERVANTFLGEGIAIPHGMQEDRHLIHRTGLAVVQVPGSLEWNPGEKVRLVVAIAAASDEHLQILANLTRILADEQQVEELATTSDPQVVVDRLTAQAAVPDAPAPEPDGYVAGQAVLGLPNGLHARPATTLVDLAKSFDADIRISAAGRVADAASLAALLGLGAGHGTVLTVAAKGREQDAAVAAIVDAIEAGLGEADEEPLPPSSATGPAWAPAGAATAVRGIGASPGVAIGPLWFLARRELVVDPDGADEIDERNRLQGALDVAKAELRGLHDDVRERSGAAQAAIFLAHAAFLDDAALLAATHDGIRAGRSAGWAWRDAVRSQVSQLEGLDDPLLAARAVDLSDAGERVLRSLATTVEDRAPLPDHPVILLADDLTPSDTAAIDPTRVVAFGTAVGGPTSHTAIIARALGIPALVGAGPSLLAQTQGATAVLDGATGTLWTGVDGADLASAAAAQRGIEQVRALEHDARFEPAVTTDGHRIEVAANVNRAQDALAAIAAGAEGVGLMRTEFLFLGRDTAPSEEEQYDALAAMVRTMNGLPLVVRTLDIGGDKNAPYLDLPSEDNSFLGIRGIRLCLERPELFLPQLRAIYRASMLGPLSVMFPMVARIEDLDGALQYAEQARREVGAEPIDVGIMVEVPSAVVLAPEFAARVKFFSIGTNDLTQYVLAMDRLHPVLARQADALHPAVLRMVKAVVDAAEQTGAWVGVCGGVAGEPEGELVLLGLGVHELSVSVPSVAAVKALTRSVSHESARTLAERALRCSTAAEVRELVRR